MPRTPRASFERWQRRVLMMGAVMDAGFGLPMLLAPEPAARVLGLSLPPERGWFALCGVLLLLLAGLYAIAARAASPVPTRMGGVAAAGRLLGSVVLLTMLYPVRSEVAFLLAGLTDLGLGLAHGALAAGAVLVRQPRP